MVFVASDFLEPELSSVTGVGFDDRVCVGLFLDTGSGLGNGKGSPG